VASINKEVEEMKQIMKIGLLLSALLFAACGGSGSEAEVMTTPSVVENDAVAETPVSETAVSDPLQVTVSILPQKYFVERIAGDHAVVTVMVPPGESPATYEPKPDQLTALNEAVVYFRIGVPFENAWMERFASVNSDMPIVDTRDGVNMRHWEDAPEKTDQHIWLSPAEVKVQAQTIKNSLAELDPDHTAAYQTNLDAFLADIEALETNIHQTLEGVTDRKFIVFHPAWGYFARDFDLEMIPIEVGGQEPSAAELADLISRAQEENIKVIFAQPEFNTSAATTVADQIGGEVLLISPLNPDWLNNLRTVATTFADVLGQ
jgi:zinc transport system substrate-binding protein